VRALYRRCVWRITVATAAAAILLLAAQPSWQRLTGALLNIDAAAAAQLWLVCLLLLGYLHVAASGTVVVAAFCAMGQASTPVRIGVAMFIVSIVVKSLGFIFWGLAGLAATTSAYYIVNMAVLSLLLEKKIDDHESA
jgi:putative peptidoglycan lipid II flippase